MFQKCYKFLVVESGWMLKLGNNIELDDFKCRISIYWVLFFMIKLNSFNLDKIYQSNGLILRKLGYEILPLKIYPSVTIDHNLVQLCSIKGLKIFHWFKKWAWKRSALIFFLFRSLIFLFSSSFSNLNEIFVIEICPFRYANSILCLSILIDPRL